MSEDDLQAKIEFVEKMKKENPRAFEFLARGSIDLLQKIKQDEEEEAKEERSKTE